MAKKMKTLHIYNTWWKKWAVRKVLEKIRSEDQTKKFDFVEISGKKFVASVYDNGDAIKEQILKVDPKAKMDLD